MTSESLIKFVNLAREFESDNLKAIILIGSGANESFVKGVSDYDFIFIFNKVNFKTLEFLDKLKFEGQSKQMLDASIDIQPLTQSEIKIARMNNSSILFFHNLALKYILEGKYKILYENEDAKIEYNYSIEGVKKDALFSAYYCLFCLRRMLIDGNSKFPPFRSVPDKDFVKLMAGLCKHVIEFLLVYNEIYCIDFLCLLHEAQRIFGFDMDPLKKAFDLRGDKNADFKILKDAYELVEKIHYKVISSNIQN